MEAVIQLYSSGLMPDQRVDLSWDPEKKIPETPSSTSIGRWSSQGSTTATHH
jgi:hypothetical protein